MSRYIGHHRMDERRRVHWMHRSERGTPMSNPLSGLVNEARKLEADAVAIFHKDVPKIAAKIEANIAQAKADLVHAIQGASPEVLTAVQNAIAVMEKAALDALL